jgi:hypothetical protein
MPIVTHLGSFDVKKILSMDSSTQLSEDWIFFISLYDGFLSPVSIWE